MTPANVWGTLPPMTERRVAVLGTRYTDLTVEEQVLGSLGVRLVAGDGGTADEYLRVSAKNAGNTRDHISVLNVPPGNRVSALQGWGVEADVVGRSELAGLHEAPAVGIVGLRVAPHLRADVAAVGLRVPALHAAVRDLGGVDAVPVG